MRVVVNFLLFLIMCVYLYLRVCVCVCVCVLPSSRVLSPRVSARNQCPQLEKNGGVAKDYYDLYGPDARASIELADKAVRWIDVQELVLWVLAQNSVMKPSWIFVNNKVR